MRNAWRKFELWLFSRGWFAIFFDPLMRYIAHKNYDMVINDSKTYLQKAYIIADFGCGSGILLKKICENKIKENGEKFVGIDRSLPLLKIGKKKFPSGMFVCADVHSLPFKNEIFDISFSTGSINLWLSPTLALDEIRRTMKKDSLFFLYDEDRAYKNLGDLKDAVLTRKLFSLGLPAYSIEEIKNFISSSGFKIVKIVKRGSVVHLVAKK